ncbi:porin [Aquabacterium sp.]|uniref:porin n=1 Tax=Aquabacterium sp. TaxID=1872578 RepID=UPI002E370CE6|nr:porin [Aquabacterium sp.]HEX5311806.1 porin [Aquabacterium sp.]
MFAKNALVAAAALVVSVAAQAQSVSVYGNLDVAVGSFEDDLTNRVTKVESGVLDGSFLGFKGQEDLGGGLKAVFKLESAIGVDAGTTDSKLWQRTSEIGLVGSFGTVTVGNSLSLSALANHTQSPFSVLGQMGLGGALNFNPFQANSVTYTSKSYSGFSGAAQYGASETRGQDSIIALQGNYAQGPLAAGVTYTEGEKQSLWQFGGSFDLGAAKLFAQYAQANDYTTKDDVNSFHLGVSAPVGANGTALASWTHTTEENTWKADQLNVAYDYALSKRTGAYAGLMYTQIKPEGGDSKSGLSAAVGLRHAF